ncbi:hypothetical protein [Cytobacillus praedii]|uniref:hypothetical protein n=1 Tax=Cytobacillus praedii TaxID=1742358 RepID=UPI0007091062|nr:hypothetical protein [Cytobacillus praedii]
MDEFGNQTEQVIEETPDTALDTTQEEIETLDTTQEEEYDVIKYNKEDVKIPVTQRQEYLQKGYNYDKVKQRADELEKSATYLDRVAKISGYQNTDELFQAIEQAEEQERIQRESQKFGVDESVYRQHFEPVNNELQQMRTELENLQKEKRHNEIDAEVKGLRSKYEDFTQYEEQVFQTAIQKGYSLEDAYKLVTYEDRIQNVARQKEQEVLAQVTGRDEKQIISTNDKPGNTTFNPESMSLKDIEALSERVQRGERITF